MAARVNTSPSHGLGEGGGGGGAHKESHEMIPDMTVHGAAPLEQSDINTFLLACVQVKEGGGFATISPGCRPPGICLDSWSYWHESAAPVKPRKYRRVERRELWSQSSWFVRRLCDCPVQSIASCSTCTAWRVPVTKDQHQGWFEV